MRTFLEIIYNCPFILLVIFTSLVFLLFFDETGNRRNIQDIAVLQFIGEGMTSGAEDGRQENRNDVIEKGGQKSDNDGEEDSVKEAVPKEENGQNAGIRKEKDDGTKINS